MLALADAGHIGALALHASDQPLGDEPVYGVAHRQTRRVEFRRKLMLGGNRGASGVRAVRDAVPDDRPDREVTGLRAAGSAIFYQVSHELFTPLGLEPFSQPLLAKR